METEQHPYANATGTLVSLGAATQRLLVHIALVRERSQNSGKEAGAETPAKSREGTPKEGAFSTGAGRS